MNSSLNSVRHSCRRLVIPRQSFTTGRTGSPATVNSSSPSVNSTEVAKFSRISKEWWNPHSTMGTGPLHQLNPIRVQYIRDQVQEHFLPGASPSRPFAGLRILDVGCGGGILSESLSRLGGQVTALDPSVENIAVATEHAQQEPGVRPLDIDYRCQTIEDFSREVRSLSSSDNLFDIVCSLEVIEHVEAPQVFLQHLTQQVKPGGLIFISTFNRTILSYLLGIVAIERIFQYLPHNTHSWDKFLQPQEVVQILSQNQVATKDITGIIGNPLPVIQEWKLSKDMDAVSYILCGEKQQARTE